MPLNKQNLNIPFSGGYDTKTDPFQISPGNFLSLKNSTFGTNKLLTKRTGYNVLPPVSGSNFITTFNGNLLSLGQNVNALLSGDSSWYSQGDYRPISVDAKSLVRGSLSQTTTDTAINFNVDLICTVWTESSGSVYYQIQDRLTTQVVKSKTQIASAVTPRVFSLGNYFIITYIIDITGTIHLRYIAIPINDPSNPHSSVSLSTVVDTVNKTYDGYVANNSLFLAYNASDVGGAVRVTLLTSSLTQGTTKIIAGFDATYISVTADLSVGNPIVYVSFYDGTSISAAAYNTSLISIFSVATIATVANIVELTSIANDGVATLLYQVSTNYSYVSKRSDVVSYVSVTQAGVAGLPVVLARGVGIASKPFSVNDINYILLVYGSSNSGLLQPTYFLMDFSGKLVGKLSYSNSGTYWSTFVLPSSTVNNNIAYLSYLRKDFLASVNPENLTPPTSTSNIYTQTGINLGIFDFDTDKFQSAEIANNLHLTGGIVWTYDGTQTTEQNFNLYPEDIKATWSATGGSIVAQPDGATNTNAYYYQVTYEWTDAQGNLHRSAPSVPVSVTTTGNGSSGSIALDIPTLRITYKTNVRIVIYRWSVGQQNYYQVTSITSPLANDPTVNSVTYTDTVADSSIVGNNLIYTTGGVVENTAPPATNSITLFKNRVVLIDAENKNLIWYSKQVLQDTPVEFSDVFTQFISPTAGAQGDTGDLTVLFPMDDKLTLFKKSAIYYMVGDGPDATGANNNFSEPIFITTTTGTEIAQSIVLIPSGLMFQSDKGIWLLGRGLDTQYIGAPVEAFNSYPVTSANTIPGTNEVRFTLLNNLMLIYDYFYNQWGSYSLSNITSGTLFQEKHTFLSSTEDIYQQSTSSYLDGSRPVLLSFTTGWMNLAGLQGFERAYYFYLLGTYYSPHKLLVNIAYDYAPPSQSIYLSPLQTYSTYGDGSFYGDGTPYGGKINLEQFRIFFDKQKCQAFQITVQEVYDSSYGVPAGQGLSISGLNLVVGAKKAYVPLQATQSSG